MSYRPVLVARHPVIACSRVARLQRPEKGPVQCLQMMGTMRREFESHYPVVSREEDDLKRCVAFLAVLKQQVGILLRAAKRVDKQFHPSHKEVAVDVPRTAYIYCPGHSTA